MIWLKKWLPWVFIAYLATSLAHFAHNAEFLTSYPNLPHWLTGWDVWLSWICLTGVGAVGYSLVRSGHERVGLLLIGLYAAMGFDGLLHYRLAPPMAHTIAMNLTIWLEVLAAAVLLAIVSMLMATLRRWRDS